MERIEGGAAPTETIDLNSLPAGDVTDSGSFDLRWMRQVAFGKLLEVMPIPALLIDANHHIMFANRACGILSETYCELPGRPFSELFAGEEQSVAAETALDKVFLDRKPQVFEGSFRVINNRLWGRMHVRSIRVRERRFVMVLIEDLTAEKKRALLNEKYKQLVNLLPVGIAEFAPATPIRLGEQEVQVIDQLLNAEAVDGNDEFARIHRFEAITELVGRRLADVLPFEGRNKTLYTNWIRSGFPISSAEAEQDLPEGGEQHIESTLIGLVKNEFLLGFWLLKRDITVSRRMKEDSFRAQKLESLGLLAGGIAHDFNNILTAILGNINLAKISAGPNEKTLSRLVEAERGSWRARDLTEQLLTFSRGGAPIKRVRSIASLLKESVTFALRGSKVVFDLAIPDDVWSVEIDEGQISQVINNLVINAHQAMPNGGLVSVAARNIQIGEERRLPIQDGNYVLISVKDQGAGIPAENIQRVFDPYFTTKHKGSGLGLATSYSIIKNHDGYIRVESEPGAGSTFYVYLPASEKEVQSQERSEGPGPRIGGNILIMDDEPMVRDVAEEMLTHIGYRVVCACDGHETLEFYKEAMKSGPPFDVVIIDLTIPGSMGGEETVQALLRIDPCARAIVSSGYSNDTILRRFEEYGFKGVVTKPYNLDELNAVLVKVMNTDPEPGGSNAPKVS
jgi:two-component system, cell cycle sensor histidine kinase and response regulator CckA